MLRRQTIIDGNEFGARCFGQFGTDRIVAIQRPHNETAAMNVIEPRWRRDSGWPIAPYRNALRHQPILLDHAGRRRRVEGGTQGIVPGALLRDIGIHGIGGIKIFATFVEGQNALFGRRLCGHSIRFKPLLA